MTATRASAGWPCRGLTHAATPTTAKPEARRTFLPLFVLGFLALALLNSVGVLPALSSALGRDLSQDARSVSKLLVLVALAGVGLGTRLSAMRRTGIRPFVVGLLTALAVSATSLLLIRLIGPAGTP